MGFATRCTACNTVFRVVQDQLKVSDGWVRCGRCHEVFNAQETLFVLEAAALAPAAPADSTRSEAEPAAATNEASLGPEVDADHRAQGPRAPVQASAPDAAGDAAPQTAVLDSGDRIEPHLSLAAVPQAPDDEALEVSAPDAAPDAAAPVDATPLAASPPAASAAAPHALTAWPAAVGDERSARSRSGPAQDAPASRLAARDRVDFEDARFNSELLADEIGDTSADTSADASVPPVVGDAEDASDDALATPEFVRRAERNARWNRPVVVAAMVLLCVVLIIGLAAQAAYHFRDLAAARYPQARPALVALCETMGCSIEPVRRIDDIVIESSALTDASGSDAMRLSVVLRNRSALPLAMPAIELALTDAAGQMLARRALLPADFGKAGGTLAAGAETPLQLVLAVDGRRPSGYTVEPFYP